LLQWLVSEGEQRPGSVLYPTCDDFAWLQAVHAHALEPHFKLYAPASEVLEKLLDKRELIEAGRRVGIESPVTYFPESDAEIEAIARDVEMPLLLKQRTQVFSSTHSKGKLIGRRNDVAASYADFLRHNVHAEAMRARMPGASRPMLQAYHHEGLSRSYLVSGIIDHTGQHIAARAANKVLQHPRTLGIALCLEAAPLDEALLKQVQALCRSIGYYGVFQVEFLSVGQRRLMIDFNPRYYHYMAFDIARGLPLPLLVHEGAQGHDDEVARLIDTAKHHDTAPHSAFTYRLQLYELLVAQTATGTMAVSESLRWRRWCAERDERLIDAVADRTDRMPEFVDAVRHVGHRLGHPRSFIRQIAFDR
jgi:predicted ATP-grasp superfamily ATP-dependent carboligase